MRMRQCTKCEAVKDDGDFSFQKTRPGLKYAWCDDCREEAKAEKKYILIRNNRLIREDYQQMREKAASMRKFSPDQCATLKTRLANGEKAKTLAEEFKVSPNTIYKASRGYTRS